MNYILQLNHLTKKFNISKGKSFTALNDFSFEFPNQGLFSIFGKSGSGKSTLLNMIAFLDKPTSGDIFVNGKRTSSWKSVDIDNYRKKTLGIIFQQYNLLEDKNGLDNILVKSLIDDKNYEESKNRAKEMCSSLNIDESLLSKNVEDMSGGEKQRIGILRAIINNPDIVLADEPTGALDYKNSVQVMELLKKISKNKLVILVSHNKDLVERYSDTIIHLKDGYINDIENLSVPEPSKEPLKKQTKNNKNAWKEKYSLSLIKKKITKSVISLVAYSIGLITSLLIIGFTNGSKEATINSSYNQIDYGVMKVTHEESTNINGSKLSIVQESRPSDDELKHLERKYKDIIFAPNISYFFPLSSKISFGEQKIEEATYNHIYSYEDKYINKDLLKYGRLPLSKDECLANIQFYNLLKKKNINPLNIDLDVSSKREYKYYTGKETRPEITDFYYVEKTLKVVGIVDDFSFLSSPKIYYSYQYDLDYLMDFELENLSEYFSKRITFYDCLLMENDDSEMSSYSLSAFYLDYLNYSKIDDLVSFKENNLVFSSLGKERKDACLTMIDSMSKGMEIFLVITLIGTIMIVGIISYSSYQEERKNIAILFSLGANIKDTISIFLTLNLAIGFASLILSFITSPLLSLIINNILFKVVGIKNIIKIPFDSFLGFRFIFPFVMILVLSLLIIISTVIPIMFSKSISISEELKEE